MDIEGQTFSMALAVLTMSAELKIEHFFKTSISKVSHIANSFYYCIMHIFRNITLLLKKISYAKHFLVVKQKKPDILSPFCQNLTKD